MAFGKSTMNPVNGMIWSTHSEIPYGMNRIIFGHILAVEVTGPTMLTPTTADLRIDVVGIITNVKHEKSFSIKKS